MATDMWADGALDTRRAAAFLGITDRFLRTIAAQQNWPKKYQGTKALYPRSLLAAYLAALPSEPPAELKERVKRLTKAP